MRFRNDLANQPADSRRTNDNPIQQQDAHIQQKNNQGVGWDARSSSRPPRFGWRRQRERPRNHRWQPRIIGSVVVQADRESSACIFRRRVLCVLCSPDVTTSRMEDTRGSATQPASACHGKGRKRRKDETVIKLVSVYIRHVKWLTRQSYFKSCM